MPMGIINILSELKYNVRDWCACYCSTAMHASIDALCEYYSILGLCYMHAGCSMTTT